MHVQMHSCRRSLQSFRRGQDSSRQLGTRRLRPSFRLHLPLIPESSVVVLAGCPSHCTISCSHRRRCRCRCRRRSSSSTAISSPRALPTSRPETTTDDARANEIERPLFQRTRQSRVRHDSHATMDQYRRGCGSWLRSSFAALSRRCCAGVHCSFLLYLSCS